MASKEQIKKNHDKIGYTPTEIEADVISIVSKFITSTKDLTTFITPEVSFNMREVLKRAKRNYLGVFENSAYDSQGNERVWHHITQSIVESEVKNTDVDPKDISIEADKPEHLGVSSILRSGLRQWMRDVEFGEAMDSDLRDRAIDGHVIRKVYEGYPVGMKKSMVMSRNVNLLRIFIDGNAESLHTSPFAEQAILYVPDIQRAYGSGAGKWMNLNLLNKKDSVKDFASDGGSTASTSVVPRAEIYEYHADIPTWWVTGDKKKWVKEGMPYKLGFVVVSNIFDCPVVHKIMFNTRGVKPYEESRLIKVSNRYLGMGRAEQLFGYQLYFNILYDMRRVNHLLSSNQLFYIRKGSGVTPQHIANLLTGGAVQVNNPDDIGRIDTREIGFNDLANEERILVDASQRLTDQNDAALGGQIPSSTPATIGAIQERSQGRGAETKRESFGRYLENLFNRHIIPLYKKGLSQGDIIKITDDPDKLARLDDAVVRYYVDKNYIERVNSGEYISPEELEMERNRVREQMRAYGKNRYVQLVESYLNSDQCKAVVNISNEHEDKVTTIRSLENILFNLPKTNPNIDADTILRTIIDKLNLDPEVVLQRKPTSPMEQMPQMQQGMPQMQGMPQIQQGISQGRPSEDSLIAEANNQI